jgi:uncharacterized protein YecE (DUF72 family)
VAEAFPSEGSGLQRYAARFDAAEVNATFYRTPRVGTFGRWVEASPPGFRFAAKIPKAITHERKLVGCADLLDAFLADVVPLASKLGPLLVQLPPSLAFDPSDAAHFFGEFRARFAGQVACEPRHASWFEPQADALLGDHRVARVAADPARHALAAVPAGWPGLAYWRLHGSPRMYFSPYDDDALQNLARQLTASQADEAWCIFDNTASGAAAADALRLHALVARV